MSDPAKPLDPRTRDVMVRRVRTAGRLIGVLAAGAAAALSAVAAHAFKGHDGHKANATVVTRRPRPAPRVSVPPPEHVPAIDNAPAPLAAPAEPPAAAAPVEQAAPPPPPETSGGS